MDKPFYQSKTFWVNGIALAVTAINSTFGWLDVTGAEATSVLTIANLALRAITKGSVTLS